VLELPEGLVTRLQKNDQATVECLQRAQAAAQIALQSPNRFRFGRQELDRTRKAAISHVDQGKGGFAVRVQTLDDFLKKLLTLLYKSANVVFVYEKASSKERICKPPSSFRYETRV